MIERIAIVLLNTVWALQLYSATGVPPVDESSNNSTLSSTSELAPPLRVVPELKEAYLCTGEGEKFLVDQYGQYLPAYPNSQFFGGKCTFDDFEDGPELGEGAFGTVALAVHKKTGIKVAIKTIFKQVLYDQIRREECLQHSIRSPLVVRHFCTISEDGFVGFVLELVEGSTLYKARKKRSNLPIVSIAAQVVLMMETLHNMNILYRDLKPENIMWVPKTHQVKLIDFGLAVPISGRKGYATGQLGTPPFMAPEIVRNQKYSFPVDWYAVGLVIYELIAGHNPFDNIKDVPTLHFHIMQGFECQLKDQIACHLIKKLTALDPTSRWGDSNSSRKWIKRHQWFADIPWEDFADGDITVLIPEPRRRRRSRHPASLPSQISQHRGNRLTPVGWKYDVEDSSDSELSDEENPLRVTVVSPDSFVYMVPQPLEESEK